MSAFRPGDVVISKTGGPEWVVLEVAETTRGEVLCFVERVTKEGVHRMWTAADALLVVRRQQPHVEPSAPAGAEPSEETLRALANAARHRVADLDARRVLQGELSAEMVEERALLVEWLEGLEGQP